jgi:hypothetical protein
MIRVSGSEIGNMDRLFRKSGVCRKASSPVVSDIDRNKLAIGIYKKPERAKK